VDRTAWIIVASAVFASLFVAGFAMRRYPGGPLMFGLQHPRAAAIVGTTFFVLTTAILVTEALRDLPQEARPLFRDYLVRVGSIALVCGLVIAGVVFVRRPRDARQAAANFAGMVRSLGSRHAWMAVFLVPALFTVVEWFNPVSSARFGVPGMVAFLGLFGPLMVLQTLRAFFFTAELPSVPGVVAALADSPPGGSADDTLT
jgi:hypothetical protein